MDAIIIMASVNAALLITVALSRNKKKTSCI